MAQYTQFRYVASGDSALVVEVGDEICPEINHIIRGLLLTVEEQRIQGIRDCVPAYCSLMILYDPALILFNELVTQIQGIESRLAHVSLPDARVVRVPVVYGGECGPDLRFVAQSHQLREEEVIRLHTGRDYLVYMLGFTPGFCYLGGMAEELETPRLAEPRTCIPAGSVGIAGKQTGVYPIDSPGGWQLIGRTPLRLFDPQREPAVIITAGDYVRFYQIEEKEWERSVKQPGLLTTVQDLGRRGFGKFGMPVAGAMDDYAVRVGNLLLGNPESAPVLEMTLIGPALLFESAMDFIVTGGDLQPCLNEQPLSGWQVYHADAGDLLTFAGIRSGCRAYLAVSGGVDVPLVMGSASTYLRGKLGGYRGRALQAGDTLFTQERTRPPSFAGWAVPEEYRPDYRDDIRVVLGPQDDAFTENGVQTFLSEAYTITHEADRMGYRLAGPKIEHARSADIISDGIAPGAIQVPAHGTPIIMLADRQTTGGYTKIATVVSVDIPSVAQKKPGEALRFARVSVEDAQALYREREATLAQLRHLLQSQFSNYTVTVDGHPYHVSIRETAIATQ